MMRVLRVKNNPAAWLHIISKYSAFDEVTSHDSLTNALINYHKNNRKEQNSMSLKSKF